MPMLSVGDVRMDRSNQLVTRNGERVVLNAHECRILLPLFERLGNVVTRDRLEAAVYGDSTGAESNTSAVYIHQLRRKLIRSLLTTVHGHGYMIGKAGS